MMRKCILLLVAAIAYILLNRAAAAEPLDAVKVDTLVGQAMQAWHVPGCAVAIVRDGRVIYLKGFGVREQSRSEPVTPDTIFPIGSCTKAFTTTAMAMLADDGKLGWDDHVRKHLPYFHLYDPVADADVRLRDLVTHRTGVGSHELLWYRSPWSLEERVRRVGRLAPQWPFRTHFQYQTVMFTAAGLAAAHAAGCDWQTLVRRRILEPLGMKHTSFTTDAALADVDHASPHRQDVRGRIKSIECYAMHTPDPAGSINSTARDLARWLRFQLGDGVWEGKRLVSSRNLVETHTPQMVIPLEGNDRDLHPDTVQMSYGMAWVIQDYHGRRLVSHAGMIDGFRAHLTLVPDANLGIALFNNLDHTQMNLALSNTLVDLILGLPRRDWNTYIKAQLRKQDEAAWQRFQERERKRHRGTFPSQPLKAYTGQYDHPAYGACRVTLKQDGLHWQWNSFHGLLEHYELDTFRLENADLGQPLMEFRPGHDGQPATLRVAAPLGVEFRKFSKPAANERTAPKR